MRVSLRPVIGLTVLPALLALSACDEVTVASATGGDAEAAAETRGLRNCLRAVENHTGLSGLATDPTVPVVEVNQYVIAVPDGPSWRCFTDDSGKAIELLEVRG